jgi:Ankyrin repeat
MTKKITDLPIELRVKIYDQCTTMNLLNFGEAKPSFIPEILKATKKASVFWFEAAANKFPNWIRTMIRLGHDINTKDNFGRAALHLAADHDIVKALINAGADLKCTKRLWLDCFALGCS